MDSKDIRRLTSLSIARLCLGVLAAITLLAAPLCIAQPRGDDRAATPMSHGEDAGCHRTQPVSKAECAVGCRLALQSAPVFEAPLRVTYDIRFEADAPGPEGVVVDPPVPPPRRAAA